MKRTSLVLLALLASCVEPPIVPKQTDPSILAEIDAAANQSRATQPEAVRDALLPPLRAEMPRVAGVPVEQRFDLVVNTAPAQQVFMSIVSGTRYSMIVNPAVSGTVSVNLKDVTVREALEAIREAYGYEFRVDGTRIYVEAAGLQTRVFQVNYLMGLRSGRSDVRVASGAVSGNVGGGPGSTTSGGVAPAGAPGMLPGLGAYGLNAISTTSLDASRVSMVSQNDFWSEVSVALRSIIGSGEGRSVVVSPQSGVVVIRALPSEHRSVEQYLKAIRVSVERQVMIEAKVIEVTLSQDYQAGVNWAAFSSNRLSTGQASQGTVLQRSPSADAGSLLITGATGVVAGGTPTATGGSIAAIPGSNLLNLTNPAQSLFGLAFQTRNFAALITFLETQGAVQVLSSPRVAALNNQKAVLKVGTDQFFVTNVQATPLSTGVTGVPTTLQVTPTFNPFFSGVSLDITPQINEDGAILLHIHPLVSDVATDPIQFDFGNGPQAFPFAKSAINETDTMVRAQDGNIVALGGLMQISVTTTKSGIPGLQDIPGIGAAFRSTQRTTVKRELVILLKPTVIKSDAEWDQDLQQVRDRYKNLGRDTATGATR
ncbi:MAG TPA: secretin N-terminal domain-containing protein [Burkholderiales bacterium]|nr:secretin N-terminal domain-containing protein [Burkholderiales bacterium]